MSSMQEQARATLENAESVARRAIDQIPPDAWPVIDLMMQIVVGLAAVWLVLSLIGWWRRRAYNLTVASTARRNKKARPGFLNVDHKGRKAAIARGEDHEEDLDERDEREEEEDRGKVEGGPLPAAGRIARLATMLMSVITLATGAMGAIFNVTRMGEYVGEMSAAGRIQHIITTYPIGSAVVAFCVGYSIWRFIAEQKWKEA